MKQYTHSISIQTVNDPVQNQVTGNYQTVTSGTTFNSVCRAEPAGSNPVLIGADGNQIVYSWIVYMPKTVNEFHFGDNVVITLENSSLYNGTVKRQSNGQFNTRIWV